MAGIPLSGISYENRVSLRARVGTIGGVNVQGGSDLAGTVLPDAAFAAAFRKTQSWSVAGRAVDAEGAASFLRDLAKTLEGQGIEVPSNLNARTAHARVEVWLEEGGAFSLCHALPEEGGRIWNFPCEMRMWLAALQSGMGALPQTESLPIATTGQKRTFGLKALRQFFLRNWTRVGAAHFYSESKRKF